MSEPETKPFDRFIDFVYEATKIFNAGRMAMDAKKLIFALAAVVLWGIGAMFINVVPLYVVLLGAGVAGTAIIFAIFAKTTDTEVASKSFILALAGSLLVVWAAVIILWFAMKADEQATRLTYCHPLWALAVAAVFGTAIARIAAVGSATGNTVGFRDAARFALKRIATSIWTLLVPVMAVLAFATILLVIGLPGRIGYFGSIWYLVVGILYIIPLLVGLFFAVVLLVYIAGLALFQPAVAAEGSDSYDAISRAYQYIFTRPWRFGFYCVLAYFYGRIVVSVAAIVVTWAGKITNAALARGIGEKMTASMQKLDLGTILGTSYFEGSGPAVNGALFIVNGNVTQSFKDASSVGGGFIVFWQYILLALFLAFAVTLFYCLITQIYFLMRKASEQTPFEEVYIEAPEEEQFAGQFAESARPAEVKRPVQELPNKELESKAKKDEEKFKPIDLADTSRKLDIDEEEK